MAPNEMTPAVLQHAGAGTDGDQYGDSTAIVVSLDKVLVADRYRHDLGDVESLARSIVNVGLLNPITVTAYYGGYRLVAGERRLRAFERLGLAEIPARVARDIAEARDLLVAERDENTERKPMLPSEATALGMAIEEMEKPAAAERQAATRFGGVPGNTTDDGHKSRDIAAEAVGLSPATYTRTKTLITTASNGDEPEDIREAAREAMVNIDNGAPIRREYDRVKAMRRPANNALPKRGTRSQQEEKWALVATLAAERLTSAQIAKQVGLTEEGLRAGAKREGITFPADEVLGKTKRINGLDVLERIVASIEADVSVLGLIEFEDITPEQAAQWLQRLASPLRAINQMKNRLKEISGV